MHPDFQAGLAAQDLKVPQDFPDLQASKVFLADLDQSAGLDNLDEMVYLVRTHFNRVIYQSFDRIQYLHKQIFPG